MEFYAAASAFPELLSASTVRTARRCSMLCQRRNFWVWPIRRLRAKFGRVNLTGWQFSFASPRSWMNVDSLEIFRVMLCIRLHLLLPIFLNKLSAAASAAAALLPPAILRLRQRERHQCPQCRQRQPHPPRHLPQEQEEHPQELVNQSAQQIQIGENIV